MKDRRAFNVATTLLIVGGLNWLLFGLFEFDLVAAIFGGPTSILSKIVYIIVGIAAVYETYLLFSRRGYRAAAGTTTFDRIDRTGRAA